MLNLWLAWLHFSLEKLIDAQEYLEGRDHMTTFDAKSGYYHVSVAKEDRPLGIAYAIFSQD